MLKLTYPSSHSLEEIALLFQKFKENCPEIYNDWFAGEVEIARRDEGLTKSDEIDPLRTWAFKEITRFLKSETDWEGSAALAMGFSDFRQLINREVAAYLKSGDGSVR